MNVVFAVSGTGVIENGWSFVWAAYGLTWLTLGGYALSLFIRSRTAGEST